MSSEKLRRPGLRKPQTRKSEINEWTFTNKDGVVS